LSVGRPALHGSWDALDGTNLLAQERLGLGATAFVGEIWAHQLAVLVVVVPLAVATGVAVVWLT